MKTSFRYLYYLLAILATIIVYALLEFTPLRIAENFYEDLLVTKASSKQPPSDRIVVLEVRETTLSKFSYRSPLDREFTAKLIAKLLASNVTAIGLDVFLDQETETKKDKFLKSTLLKGKDKIFVARASKQDGLTNEQLAFQSVFLEGVQSGLVTV